MNPNGQIPENYLDEIAPAPKKGLLPTGKMRNLVIIGGILTLLVIAASITVSVINGGKKDDWARLATRITSTSEIVSDATKNIKNNRLRSINSELSIFLINLDRDLQTPLTSIGFNKNKVSKSILKETSVAQALENLEDARLNDVYDRAYAREMTYQLAQILTDLQKAHSNSGNDDTKKFLSDAYDSLESNHETLSSYSESTD